MTETMQTHPMEVDADHSSIPIVDLSEKMKTLQCEEPNGTIRSCAYLKNGKLDFYEPKLLLENHMLIAQKIIFFRDFRYKIETTHDLHTHPLEIPPAYLDVIASVIQDSDESLYALTSRVNDLLSPYGRDESLSHKFESAIQKAIEQVATRVKYGLSKEVYKSIKNTTDKMPWHLYIYRWEVKDMNFFPPEIQQAVLARKKKRMEMSEEVSNYIKSLPVEESLGLINAKHRRADNNEKWSAKIEKERQQREEDKKKWEDEKKRRQEEQRQREEEKKKKREEEKKLKEEQKIKREEEKKLKEEQRIKREEEKKLKEEQKKKREDDKKKKEQSQLRLTSLFTKAAPNENTIPEKIVEPSKPTLFPPFYVKDNVTITENTTFNWPSPSSDTDDFVNKIRSPSNNINVHTFLSELPSEAKQKRGFTPSIDIRTLLLPGSADLLNTPHVRMTLRMKLLQFTEDVRPAYYGTFTQKSSVITGKTPFAQDTSNFDYEVDSEAEWEPEGEGEEINSGDEDEEEVSDYVDPEDSGWVVPEGYLSDNEGVEGEHDQLNKPRTANAPKKKAVIRKIVLGPYFEGETDQDETMKPFEMQFLIDIPEQGFDPFFEEPSRKNTSNITSFTNAANIGISSTPQSSIPNHNKVEFTEEHKNALINLINEKQSDSIPSIISEAKATDILKDVSKRQLEARIKDIAIKEKRGSDTRATWYIKEASP